MPASTLRRAARVRLPGGLPLLVALLLGLLQAGMPFAHALLHVAARAQVQQAQEATQPEFRATLADERPCALCAADELPALPGLRPAAVPLRATSALRRTDAATERSSAPLEVFCRPPPVL